MLGSNFPPEKLSSTYADVRSAFETLLAELTHNEREKLFFHTSAEVYRLEN